MNRASFNFFNASPSDFLNTATLILSFILACIIPFDLILLSYAFLGPLHYLTQISWMQKRSFFNGYKLFPWIAAAFSVAFTVIYLFFVENVQFGLVEAEGFAFYNNLFGYIFYTSFIVAILSLTDETFIRKFLYLIGSQLLFVLMYFQWQEFILALALLVPTIIHVYVFTWAFMLDGAIKSKSIIGYFNCAFMIFLGVLIMIVLSEDGNTVWLDLTYVNIGYFTPAAEYIQRLFASFGETGGAAGIGFLSFAFTFHYLNWFSKINVIRWHDVSKRRMLLIVGLSLFSVSLFLYDYYTGLLVLIFLSIYHIITEFPLNILTFKSLLGRVSFNRI